MVQWATVIGTCHNEGDIIVFYDGTSTGITYRIYDRYSGEPCFDAFFWCLIGY